jgi:hypothetical protein
MSRIDIPVAALQPLKQNLRRAIREPDWSVHPSIPAMRLVLTDFRDPTILGRQNSCATALTFEPAGLDHLRSLHDRRI